MHSSSVTQGPCVLPAKLSGGRGGKGTALKTQDSPVTSNVDSALRSPSPGTKSACPTLCLNLKSRSCASRWVSQAGLISRYHEHLAWETTLGEGGT